MTHTHNIGTLIVYYTRPDLSLWRGWHILYTHTRKSISSFERLLAVVVVVVVVGGVVNQSNKVPNNIYRLDASSCRRIKHDRIVEQYCFFPFFLFDLSIYFSRLFFMQSCMYIIYIYYIAGTTIHIMMTFPLYESVFKKKQ